MLQDIEAELEKEMADDKAVYSMLTCWCTKNDEEKTKAIEVATANIAQLEASLSAAAAKVKELKAKRKATMDEMYAGQKALGEAQQIRMEENKAFHSEETDLMEAVAACKGALVALSKHHADLAQVQAVARQLRRAKVEELALGPGMSTRIGPTLARARTQALKSFLDAATTEPAASSSAFMAIPGMQSYAPQSGQIFGILKQMKADFESSLSEAQKAEVKAAQEFEDLKAAKEEEISAAKKLVEDIDVQVAELGEKAAQETKELEATEEQLGMDQQFLADLKAKCSESDKEFETRTASRLEEIAAVQDAIKILNSDESFGAFEKTTKGFVEDQDFVAASAGVSLLQADAETAVAGVRRSRAAQVLRATGLPRLVLLASSVQEGVFDKVIAEVERLAAELSQQQKDEVKHRDYCVAELADNERDTSAADHKKDNLVQKEADLEQTIKELAEKMAVTKEEAAEVQSQMKRSSEIREAENADFQEVVQDQRLTQMILGKALTRLKEVYSLMQQQPGAAHIATSGTKTDAGNAPARFTKYEKNAGGGRVVMLLEKIAADAKKLEDEAVAGEMSAQNVYEDFMKQSNKQLTAYGESLQSMQAAKATAESDLSMTKTDLKDTLKELEGLNSYLGDLHKSCDFIMKNFDARQEARAQEIEALGEAKAILSGMN
jgi:chromosome segregation ATPase